MKRKKTDDGINHDHIILDEASQIVRIMPNGQTATYKGSISPRRKGKLINIKV